MAPLANSRVRCLRTTTRDLRQPGGHNGVRDVSSAVNALFMAVIWRSSHERRSHIGAAETVIAALHPQPEPPKESELGFVPAARSQRLFGFALTLTISTSPSVPWKSAGLAVYSGSRLLAAVAAICRSEERLRGCRPAARTAAQIWP